LEGYSERPSEDPQWHRRGIFHGGHKGLVSIINVTDFFLMLSVVEYERSK
jgi:hypothetical protein